jgi:hypothetical protein
VCFECLVGVRVTNSRRIFTEKVQEVGTYRMARLTRPSTASRWGCGSRLRRIWIALASAIVLLQVVLFRCTVCMYVYMWRPCLRLESFLACVSCLPAPADARSAPRWRVRMQVAVARTNPCRASTQEGCPLSRCNAG